MHDALRSHWPEYLMEAAGLGLFMVAACCFGTLIENPGSPVRQAVPHPAERLALMGLAMGMTAAGLFYSPWGKRSGAHLNPSVTLVFLRLGKVRPADAAFYAAAQALGGLAGVLLSAVVLGRALAHPAVNFVATVPGPRGPAVAFAGEAAISFVMIGTVLAVSSSRRPRLTGLAAATLVGVWIAFEAPFSGMSMNPARTVASALPSGTWTAAWVYFLAPPLGMLLAAEAFGALTRGRARHCAKLDHDPGVPCIFCRTGAVEVQPGRSEASGRRGIGTYRIRTVHEEDQADLMNGPG